MQITVINHDKKINVFKNQPDDESLVEDLMNAVVSGSGFALHGPRGTIAYGPGTIARVGFTDFKPKEKTDG